MGLAFCKDIRYSSRNSINTLCPEDLDYDDDRVFRSEPVLCGSRFKRHVQDSSNNDPFVKTKHTFQNDSVRMNSRLRLVNSQSTQFPLSKESNRRKKYGGGLKRSLKEKILEYQKNPRKYFVRDEHQAKFHMTSLHNSSMAILSNTFLIADSMIEKGEHISDELVKQSGVISTAASDLSMSFETSSSDEIVILRSRYPSDDELFLQGVNSKVEDRGDHHSILSPPTSCNKRIFNAGVQQLVSAFEKIEKQQMGISKNFDHDEKTLNRLSCKIDKVGKNINKQTYHVKRKLRKAKAM